MKERKLDNNFVEQAKWFLAHSELTPEDICFDINCTKCFKHKFYDNEYLYSIESFCSTEKMIQAAKHYLRNEKLKKLKL